MTWSLQSIWEGPTIGKSLCSQYLTFFDMCTSFEKNLRVWQGQCFGFCSESSESLVYC